jgi:hypothetical protein
MDGGEAQLAKTAYGPVGADFIFNLSLLSAFFRHPRSGLKEERFRKGGKAFCIGQAHK